MKRTELEKNFTSYEVRCLTDTFQEETSIFLKYWKKAKSKEEFINFIKKDNNLAFSQAVGVIFRNDINFIKNHLSNKFFETISDVGSVKIGNENFNILVPNGFGDGITKVAIFDKYEKVNTSLFEFFTQIDGNINIYKYDCGNEIDKTIKGKYQIYKSNGFVIFKEI